MSRPNSDLDADGVPLSSALFQASVWLESAHPAGSMEAVIAGICWKAHEALEGLEAEIAEIRSTQKKSDIETRASSSVRHHRAGWL